MAATTNSSTSNEAAPPRLVVGADGLIGAALVAELRRLGEPVVGTSRRPGSPHLPLDFERPEIRGVVPDADVAFICAGMTRLKDCADEPIRSHRINVERSVELATALGRQGAFVVFLSTSAVFSGDWPFASENAPVSPRGAYGRQKAEAEQRLLASGFPVAIVRLTKVLSRMTPLIRSWLDDLSRGREIAAYHDLLFAPVSLRYAVDALLTIAEKREPGVFHLSGSRDVSYADFACDAVRALGRGERRVRPEKAPAEVSLPRHAALGMELTRARVGLPPQPPDGVLEHLLRERAAA